MKGKIIRPDEQSYNRAIEFGKPGEHPVELIHRVLGIAEKAEAVAKNGLTIY